MPSIGIGVFVHIIHIEFIQILSFELLAGFHHHQSALQHKPYPIRNKFGADFVVNKKLRPFVSGEFSLRLADNDGAWHKWRTTMGLQYRIKRAHRLSLFYRLEGMLNGSNAPLEHILGPQSLYYLSAFRAQGAA